MQDEISKKSGKFRAFLWNKFNKFQNFFIGKVFNVRFAVNGEKVNGTILKNKSKHSASYIL